MANDPNESNRGRPLVFEGECTIENAGAIRESLMEAMESTDSLVVDLGGVTGVDACFLQLLCAAHRQSLELGKRLALGPRRPAVLKETARAAGYYRRMGCHKDPGKDCLWQGGYQE